jgi:hypothetical protein
LFPDCFTSIMLLDVYCFGALLRFKDMMRLCGFDSEFTFAS